MRADSSAGGGESIGLTGVPQMNAALSRPASVFDPARGLLRNEHFQVAYVTTDLERACGVFKERLGIVEFGGLEGEMPSGGFIKIRLAWVGSTMYELVQCSGPGSEMYNETLSAGEFAIGFHHLGFLVPDQNAWDKLLDTIDREGREIRQQNNTEGFMRHCYIRVPELGHHLEYMFPEQAGIDFLEKIPAS